MTVKGIPFPFKRFKRFIVVIPVPKSDVAGDERKCGNLRTSAPRSGWVPWQMRVLIFPGAELVYHNQSCSISTFTWPSR
jgi:hypothetical protein